MDLCAEVDIDPSKAFLVLSPFPAEACDVGKPDTLGRQYAFSALSVGIPVKPNCDYEGLIILHTEKEPIVE